MSKRPFDIQRRHLWLIAALALIWIFQSFATIEPFDFWWNAASGRWMAEHGRFLADDVLVYSPVRRPYSNPQWGAQLLFYGLFSVAPGLLLLARVAIVTATYGLLYAICYRRTRSWGWAAVATLVAYISGFTNYGMRPQLFAFLPFVVFLWLLERKSDHPRALWWLTPIMIVWVNVHGSYFLGWGLLGLYSLGTLLTRLGDAAGQTWLRRQWARRELLPLTVAALAAFVNPYGLGIVRYFFIATGDATARSLNIEWQPPTLYNGTGILFFANVGLFFALLLAARRAVGWIEGLLLAVFGLLALLSLRNCLWWNWVTAPGVALSGAALVARGRAWLPTGSPADVLTAAGAGTAAPPPARPLGDIPILNWGITAFLIGVGLAVAPIWKTPAAALAPTTPTAVAHWLAGRPPHGPLFNYMEWGGYLEWTLFPSRQLFIDGRFEAREPQVWDDYLAISRGAPDWQARLDKYGVQTLVLNRSFDSALIPLVSASPHWSQVYPAQPADDPAAVVFFVHP